MAKFTALRHSWDYPESINVDDFIYATNTEALNGANGDGMGVCWDGTFFYVVNITDAKVFKYNSAWAYQTTFNLDALNGNPQGITWDGTFFYVTDWADNKVYKYNTAFVLQDSFAIIGTNAAGICFDGTYFYIIEWTSQKKVFKYNSAWVLQGSFSVGPAPWGIAWDGTYFYVNDWFFYKIYKYNTAFVLQDEISFAPASNVGKGIAWGGDYLYAIDRNDNVAYVYPNEWRKTIAGHRDCVILYDGMSETFAAAHLTGVIEYWIRAIDAADEVKIILKDATGNACINIEIDSDKIIGDGTDALDPALDNTFYLISIDFDCTPNTYDLWVNGVKELDGQAFGVNDDGSGLTVMVIAMDTDKNGYLDGIGYDWDVDYSAGDNLLDTVDVTDDITGCKITEELGESSFAELDLKGSSVSDFESGHEIAFYDSDTVLSWTGIILFPENVLVGENETVGKMKLLGLNNKFFNTYRKNFTTARDSDYIIKNIIDNKLTRYHSYDDEIDNFTITHKYDLKTKIQKMYNYLVMLERAVIHYKPNGEIFFNKYNNLSATGLSWTQDTSIVKITAYTPQANRHVTRTPVIGAYNNLGQVHYVGIGTEDEEDNFGINELQVWRDPEISNYTEAKQLGDNLQEIYSLDTQMISMLVVNKKHIQVGYTVQLSWNILFNVALGNFLVTKRVWYPITDVCEVDLTDNILTRKAFNLRVINKFYDEDAQEGYEDPNIPESGGDGTVLPLSSIAELRAFGIAPLGMSLFLHIEGSADIGGYKLMSTDFPDDVITEVFNATITSDDQEIEQYATPIGAPGIVFIPDGIYDLHFHGYKFSGTKDVRLYFKIYKRAHPGGAETLLATSEESRILEDSSSKFDIHVRIDDTNLLITDRLVIKIFARLIGVGSNPVVYFYVEGESMTRFVVPTLSGAGVSVSDLSRVVVGTYTGDGAGNGANWNAKQSIDVGFEPDYFRIIGDTNGGDFINGINQGHHAASDEVARHRHDGLAFGAVPWMVRFTAIGFDVQDEGADAEPNVNGRPYIYIAIKADSL